MKPALVLGLALAANAMTADSGDNNELFVAPTGKLNDHIQRFPGKFVMYDEVADDELAVKYVHLPHNPVPEYVAYDDDELLIRPLAPRMTADDAADELLFFNKELLPNDGIRRFYTPYFDKETGQWKIAPGQYTKVAAFDDDELLAKKPRKEDSKTTKDYIRNQGWTRPEAAADELFTFNRDILTKITPVQIKLADDEELFFAPGQRIGNLAGPYPTLNFDDVADDELLVAPTRDFSRHPFDSNGHVLRDNIGRPVRPVLSRFDEVADDELAMRNPSADQYQRLQNNKNLIYSKYDEVADDELAVKYVNLPVREFVAYDDDELAYVPPVLADDELAITPEQYHRVQNLGSIHARYDEVADDELAITQQIVHFPEFIAYDDDELMRTLPPISSFGSYSEWAKHIKMMSEEPDNELGVKYVHLPIEHVAYDDELAYLGHLLNERAQPRSFDEFKKTEKPSHGKTKEKNQTKRKFRPAVDEVPLTQN